MKLSHSANNDFFRLLINGHSECWIFFLKFRQCFMHLCCSVFICCFYCITHHGLWNKHTLTLDDVVHVSFSKCFAGGAVTTKDSKNITCFDFWNVLHLICMHFCHSTDFQFFSQLITPNIISFLHSALINSDIT